MQPMIPIKNVFVTRAISTEGTTWFPDRNWRKWAAHPCERLASGLWKLSASSSRYPSTLRYNKFLEIAHERNCSVCVSVAALIDVTTQECQLFRLFGEAQPENQGRMSAIGKMTGVWHPPILGYYPPNPITHWEDFQSWFGFAIERARHRRCW